MNKNYKTLLSEVSGIGSVEKDDADAITVNFMNISIRMCKHRLHVFAGLITTAAATVAEAEKKKLTVPNKFFVPKGQKQILN